MPFFCFFFLGGRFLNIFSSFSEFLLFSVFFFLIFFLNVCLSFEDCLPLLSLCKVTKHYYPGCMSCWLGYSYWVGWGYSSKCNMAYATAQLHRVASELRTLTRSLLLLWALLVAVNVVSKLKHRAEVLAKNVFAAFVKCLWKKHRSHNLSHFGVAQTCYITGHVRDPVPAECAASLAAALAKPAAPLTVGQF